MSNAGSASLTGVTVNFQSNSATGAGGGHGGAGGFSSGGEGGIGTTGGYRFSGVGGTGGDGGVGNAGLGGAIFNATTGTLTIAPRTGARRGSKQSKSTDTITANQAIGGPAGLAGAGEAQPAVRAKLLEAQPIRGFPAWPDFPDFRVPALAAAWSSFLAAT